MSISDRTASIRTHLEEDYNALETLGVSVENRNIENIKDMAQQIYNKFPKTEYQEGSSVTLENTLKGRLDFDKLEGDTYQETTNGYQMLGLTNGTYGKYGITVTVENGEITINGTATANALVDVPVSTNYTLTQGETYTITANNPVATTNSDDVRIRTQSSGTFDVYCNSINAGRTFTLNSNDGLSTKIIVRVQNGATLTNFKLKPMLEKGSTAHSWEKFTGGIPSPNPSYKEDVQVVTGEQEVTIRGKNWFDKNTTALGSNHSVTPLSTGIKVTYTGTSTSTTKFTYYALLDLTNYVGKTFRLKANINSSSTNRGKYYIGLCNSEGGNRVSKSTSTSTVSGEGNTISYTVLASDLTDTVKYLCLAFYSNSDAANTLNNGDYVEYTDVTLTIDNEDMTYEPYITPITKQLSLGDIELAKISTYKDLIFKNIPSNPYYSSSLVEGAWYKLGNIGKKILNGTENNWVNNVPTGSDLRRFYMYISDIYKYTDQSRHADKHLNNYFLVNISGNYGTSFQYQTQIFFYVYNTDFPDDTVWKSWLSLHNIILYYVLNDFTYTQITDTTLISQLEDIYNLMSNNGTTIIEVSGNLPLILKVRSLKAS